MIDPELLRILQCPRCGARLQGHDDVLLCEKCSVEFACVDGVPIFAEGALDEPAEIEMNRTKWHEWWHDLDWEQQRKAYETENLPHILRHLDVHPSTWFLEIGGGPSYLSFELSSRGVNSVSVDLDLDVLRKAQQHFRRHNRSGHFVCASMMHLPFRSGVFASSAGIGVLEHSRHIEQAAAEIARVTEPTGTTFQTVPHLSLLTLLTGSIRYGTVPRAPILKALVPAVHIGLLRMRHMQAGYEESYSHRFLKRVFRSRGFQQVDVGFYDYGQTLFKASRAHRFFRKLITFHWFGYYPFDDIAYVKATR